MFHRGELITVTISGYAFGGNGVAKIPTEEGDFVVFVKTTSEVFNSQTNRLMVIMIVVLFL